MTRPPPPRHLEFFGNRITAAELHLVRCLQAVKKIVTPGGVPTVLTDGGVENVNGKVDELIQTGC